MLKQRLSGSRAAEPAPAACTGLVSPASVRPNFAVSRTPAHRPSRHLQRLPPSQGMRRSPVITPDITLGKGEEETYMGLFQYLLTKRIVFVGGYINDKMCTQVVGSLMALEQLDEKAEIRMYINSPGGSPYAVLGLVDTMLSIKPPIQTLALGACYSYASLVLAAGTKGKRLAMKNTRIMMTQPMGGSQGDWWAISKTVQELNALYQLYAKYYMKLTGMDQDTVERSTSRDCFLTPEQALQLGVVDDIVRGKGDFTQPPGIVKQLTQLGVYDDLNPGPYRVQ